MPQDKLTRKIKAAQAKRDAMQKIEDVLVDSPVRKAERKKLTAQFNALRDKRDDIILSIDARLPKAGRNGVFYSDRARFQARVNGAHFMERSKDMLALLVDTQKKMGKKNVSVGSMRREFDIALTRAEMKTFTTKGPESLSWEIKRATQIAQERKEEEARDRKRARPSGKTAPQAPQDDTLDILSRHFERRGGSDPDRPMDRNYAAEKALYNRLHRWDEYPVSEDEKISREREVERILYGDRSLNPD